MTTAPRSENGSATRRKLITLIAPAYNEAENAAGLVGFYREIKSRHADLDFELVVVDDGSTDGTAETVLAALQADDVARVASLSRNFGAHPAVTAGLGLARGDAAITLSADLQEPMEAIDDFISAWRAGYDVVWGLREIRAVPKGIGNWLSRRFSSVFHKFSDIPTFPKEGPSQVLVSRRAIDTVNAMPERNRNVIAMFAWIGFDQTTIAFKQKERPAGKSKWTSAKKIRLVVDSFVQFSAAPFLITFVLGLIIAGLGFLGALAVLIVALATVSGPAGWGLAVSSIFFLGGLQLSVLGGFGEYLWRAGDDARKRPVFILRGVNDHGKPTMSLQTRSAAGYVPPAEPGQSSVGPKRALRE